MGSLDIPNNPIATAVSGFWLALSLSVIAPRLLPAEEPDVGETPEARAVRFLAREVAAWPAKNECFSCHNNGDAARALFAAADLLGPEAPAALEATTDWLRHPDRWEHNGGEGEFNDRKLATLQFGFALSEAVRLGQIDDDRSLLEAARKVAELQAPDGSWQTETAGTIGSPITYGRTLATVAARQTLLTAGANRFQPALASAEEWLMQQRPQRVLDCAAWLAAFPDSADGDTTQHARCLEVIRSGQDKNGGWGPHGRARAEPFDTAIVLLALSELPASPTLDRLVAQGRAYLVETQQADGSWPETTRPPGAESYAHRISTTGWATLALLATRNRTPDN